MSCPNAIADCPMPSLSHHADELKGLLSAASTVRQNEPLDRRTTLRVGGPADVYLEPGTEHDLAVVLDYCAGQSLPFFVLGRGSNLLVRDGGYRGAVICLAQPAFSQIQVEGRQLRCGAGARLKSVSQEARRRALAGLEFLEGIPGSVGGALRMNAGAMGGAMFDIVVSVRLMDFHGAARDASPAELKVEYRGCETLKSNIALGALLAGRPDTQAAIEQRMAVFSQKRWASQPAAPSAGCLFKNPPQIPAGKLIDELGLKKHRVGGALVSAEHGNFIVNDGTATARDVLELIGLIQARARDERGIELRTEVEIIGVD